MISDAQDLALSKPKPISTPLTALMLIKICAKSPSSLPKTGSPSPAGTPVAIVSTIPPIESPSCFLERINSSISFAASRSPHLTLFLLMFSSRLS